MKKVLVLAIIAFILPFISQAHSQEIDSLVLPVSYVSPGDTVSLSLFLRNASFPVGGFSVRIMLIDSTLGHFVGVLRGAAVYDFAFFQAPWSNVSIQITGIFSLPHYEPIPPLPLGHHEIARLKVAIDDAAEPGTYLNVFFDRTGAPLNMITDSSGYEIAEPFTLDGMILVVQTTGLKENMQVPLKFELRNNYPNPFNAGTTIEFTIAESAYITLDVYDILGKHIRRLYNGFTPTGEYSVIWDGRNGNDQLMPSGIYFYRLCHGNNTVTRKMNLIK